MIFDLPPDPPAWLTNVRQNHLSFVRGKYNFAVYGVPTLARDLNGVAVGHAMAYEDLVTGKAATLETATYERIVRVLKNPPRFMPAERLISNTFARRFGVLEQIFDHAHLLHAQTVDVLASPTMTLAQKEAQIERLYRLYRTTVPYAITPLPMHMGYLYGQPYSRRFLRRYPRVNGLFWGYHWLQSAMYDALYGKSRTEQRAVYEVVGARYREVELWRTDRIFMPMTAETSPRFSARFPEIANVFDNLHMLHDMVNDILASDEMDRAEQDRQVRRAIWLVMEKAHEDEKPGDVATPVGWHDHRFMAGMPGMGLMPDTEPDQMFMPGLGWMSLAECHHCSMPLIADPKLAWQVHSVTADGWTMRVRCPLCARDMSAETKGRAILHLATEDPERPVILISDERGNLITERSDAVFLEEEGGHVGCHEWSRVFTSAAAFARFAAANPQYKDARPLPLAAWIDRIGKRPDTYFRRTGKPGNPFDGGGQQP